MYSRTSIIRTFSSGPDFSMNVNDPIILDDFPELKDKNETRNSC